MAQRTRYNDDVRRHAAELFAGGAGRRAVARELGIPEATARQWAHAFAVDGEKGVRNAGAARASYEMETKLDAVRDHLERGNYRDYTAPAPKEKKPKGKNAKLTDLRTGKSLNIYIQSTGSHADVEPLTAADTTTLCSIYGVGAPSQITYERRPMLITVGNNIQFVCSIYGEQHGSDTISNNNFAGQFCLHFLNSKTHGTDRVDKDHQQAIKDAVTLLEAKTVNVNGVETKIQVKTTYP